MWKRAPATRGGAWLSCLCMVALAFWLDVRVARADEPTTQSKPVTGAPSVAGAVRAGEKDPPTAAAPKQSHGHKKKKKKKHKKHRRKKKRHKKKRKSLDASARAGSGYIHGRKTRNFDSEQIAAGLKLRYRPHFGDLSLKIPVSVEHLQPLAVPLRQSSGSAGLDLDYRVLKPLKLLAGGGVLGVWRPDWPDLYQPQPDGSLARTDRHSYWKRDAFVGVAARVFDGSHVRLKYRYFIKEYVQDPNFEPIEDPNHLTPSNNVEHSLTGSWRTYLGKHNLGASLEYYARYYPFTFARDRYTGATHAGAGGPPPNPLQRYRGWVPEVYGKWSLSSRLALRPGLAVTFNRDTFQGYYSYVEVAPKLRIEWRPYSGFRLAATWALSARRYGPDSYREGDNHPPLDYGSRRRDLQNQFNLTLTHKVRGPLSLVLESNLVRRVTNFPDYEPGVFPEGKNYYIPWDYWNFDTMLHLRCRVF